MLCLSDLSVGWSTKHSTICFPYFIYEEIGKTLEMFGVPCYLNKDLTKRSFYNIGIRHFDLFNRFSVIHDKQRSKEATLLLSTMSVRERVMIQVKAADLILASIQFMRHNTEPHPDLDVTVEQAASISETLKGTIASNGFRMFEDYPAIYTYLVTSFVLERGLDCTEEDFLVSPQMGALLYYARGDGTARRVTKFLREDCRISPEIIRLLTKGFNWNPGESCEEYAFRYSSHADTSKTRALLKRVIDSWSSIPGMVNGRLNRMPLFLDAFDSAGVP